MLNDHPKAVLIGWAEKGLTLRRCRGWKEKVHMTGSHCLTAAALPNDPPMEWLDGRLTGKEKRSLLEHEMPVPRPSG